LPHWLNVRYSARRAKPIEGSGAFLLNFFGAGSMFQSFDLQLLVEFHAGVT
jgi:hypothetical protein